MKNGLMQKTMAHEKYQNGRLWAHIKHVEMKNTIRKIKESDGTLKEEEKPLDEKAQDMLRS